MEVELRKRAIMEQSLGRLTGGELRLHFRQWPRAWQRQPWCAGRVEGGPAQHRCGAKVGRGGTAALKLAKS